MYTQPWYAFIETQVYRISGKTWFTHKEIVIPLPLLGSLRITAFRLIWRSAYVVFTTGRKTDLGCAVLCCAARCCAMLYCAALAVYDTDSRPACALR